MSESNSNPNVNLNESARKAADELKKKLEENEENIEKAKGWFRSHKEEVLAAAMVGGVLIVGYRMGFKRADKKTVKALAEVFGVENVKSLSKLGEALDEMQRQALGYGFEIGAGQNMTDMVNVSFDNPFINKDWRKYITEGGKAVTGAVSQMQRPKA